MTIRILLNSFLQILNKKSLIFLFIFSHIFLLFCFTTLVDSQEATEGGCPSGFYNKTGRDQCEEECDKEFYYISLFTYGACVNAPTRSIGKNAPQCNLTCGIRLQLWATIAIFVIIAAALVSLILLLPMCVTNCLSCLHSKKASKHSRRVAMEQPSKEQQMATLSYNPYAYWPYYGR
uniref:Uncharacterized protein n=1 Tax=Meloidogyne enterolobii TaxID=390850 RepID=A0A6V7VPX0_MELEN|nr:unnamed protein product [Meloidogyne enterolobii]